MVLILEGIMQFNQSTIFTFRWTSTHHLPLQPGKEVAVVDPVGEISVLASKVFLKQ